MNEQEMQDLVRDSLELWDDSGDEVASVSTFEEAGVMTYNKGLVVRMDDGSEFQVTIIQSA